MSNIEGNIIEEFHIPPSNYNYIDVVYCICLPIRKRYMKDVFDHYKSLRPRLNWIKPIMKNDLDMQELKDEHIISKDCKLKKGEIACYLSHMKTINTFLHSNHKTCLIFEDDIKIEKDDEYITQELDAIMKKVPNDYGLVNLGRCWDICSLQKKVNDDFVVSKKGKCAHAYIVNRVGASIIFENGFPIIFPYDHLFSKLKPQKLVTYSLYSSNLFNQNRESSGILSSTLDNTDELKPCQDEVIFNKYILCIIILIIIGVIVIISKNYNSKKKTI